MSSIAAAMAAGMSPNLLGCAAHEIGHALAFQQAGVPVRSIRVWLRRRETNHWRGVTQPATGRRVTDAELPGWQIVLLVGEAATYRYLRHHAGFAHRDARAIAEDSAADDLAEFSSTRGKGLSLTDARKHAAALVERHGRRLDRLTLRLATAQRLPGSAL